MAFDNILGALAPNSAYAARQGKIAAIPTALVQDAARVPLAVAEPLAGAVNRLPQQYPQLTQLVQSLAPIAANIGDPTAASRIRLNQAMIPYYQARQDEALATASSIGRSSALEQEMQTSIADEIPNFDPMNLRHLAQAESIAHRIGGPDAVKSVREGYGTASKVDDVQNIQKSFFDLSAQNREVESAYRTLVAANGNTAVGAQNIISSFIRMIDPGSVVREGEYDRVAAAGGVPAWIASNMNKYFREGQIPEDVELYLRQEAAAIVNARRDGEMRSWDTTRKMISDSGNDPEVLRHNRPMPGVATGGRVEASGIHGGKKDLVWASEAPEDPPDTAPPTYNAYPLWSRSERKWYWRYPDPTQPHGFSIVPVGSP